MLKILSKIGRGADKASRGSRKVWHRMGPFLVALTAMFAAVGAAALFSLQEGKAAGQYWLLAAVGGGTFVIVYMLSRVWFAKNWAGRIDRAIAASTPAPVMVKPSGNVREPFRPLPRQRWRWRGRTQDEAARFAHILAYLRVVAMDERPSLDFCEAAILRTWQQTAGVLDPEVIDILGHINLWMRETESALLAAQSMTRAQHLLQCERLIQSLVKIAFKSRAYLTERQVDGALGFIAQSGNFDRL